MIEAMDTVSEKNLSKRNDISQSSVSRILNPILFESKRSYNYLPEHLMMDELKVTKAEDGASMSFIYADAENHKIIDILPDRRLPQLREHFLGFPKEVRDSVKTITIDMYSPYISLIKELFTGARIIVDRFHVVQLLLRALLKTRIQTMNGFSTDSREYKLFKKYWKHLQKSPRKLNSSQYFYCYNRRCYTTSLDTVEEILEIDSGFYKNDWRVHSLMDAFMDRDKERFYNLLESDTQGLGMCQRSCRV